MKGQYIRNSPEETKRKLKILKKLQRLSLLEKIRIANDVINKSLEVGKAAILFSGGKDSTVLLHLLNDYKDQLIVVHNDTTLGSKKNLYNLRKQVQGYNYIETTADDPFLMWEEKGYYPILSKMGFSAYKKKFPELRSSPVQCCYQLKEKYSNKILLKNKVKVVFWGNRAGESNRRKFSFVDNGFLFKPKKYKWYQSYPLQHFTDQDIIKYLETYIPNYKISSAHESGCLCCGTDLTFKDNTLIRLYINDYNAWLKYMLRGFAKQILTAKGYNGLSDKKIKDIIYNKPNYLFRI